MLKSAGNQIPPVCCRFLKHTAVFLGTGKWQGVDLLKEDCYTSDITNENTSKEDDGMRFERIQIDFNSDEAIYVQLRNQIILGIATAQLQEGDTLPSVRWLADCIGINMHTVNKAYSVLRQEGILTIDRRKGAVIRIDADKLYAEEELREELQVILAKAFCKNISKEEVHHMVDAIYESYLPLSRNSEKGGRID